jgi:hypothetical protein
MSMILSWVTLADENIERILDNPSLVLRVVAPDDAETGEDDLTLSEQELITCDLDKSWHGIHYLLTGSAWEGSPPLNFLRAS